MIFVNVSYVIVNKQLFHASLKYKQIIIPR